MYVLTKDDMMPRIGFMACMAEGKMLRVRELNRTLNSASFLLVSDIFFLATKAQLNTCTCVSVCVSVCLSVCGQN